MLVLAISKKGNEYLYKANTARAVSKASAKKIMDIVNRADYLINNDFETWYIHEIGKYDRAFDYAQYQKFTIRKGVVTDKSI